jgi:hypothetical protein
MMCLRPTNKRVLASSTRWWSKYGLSNANLKMPNDELVKRLEGRLQDDFSRDFLSIGMEFPYIERGAGANDAFRVILTFSRSTKGERPPRKHGTQGSEPRSRFRAKICMSRCGLRPSTTWQKNSGCPAHISQGFVQRLMCLAHRGPPGGQWQKKTIGKAVPRPELPVALPGDQLRWAKGKALAIPVKVRTRRERDGAVVTDLAPWA